jgi:methylated-DNA-protein-cysteine methyltransferase related protein
MAKGSPFYERIKRDTLAIVRSIPKGRLITYRNIGEHLDVVPRHIAYILGTLEPTEYAQYPWYRVVPDKGLLGKEKVNTFGISQRQMLAEEGITTSPQGSIVDFVQREQKVGELNSGVQKQTRPANAPKR